MVLRFGTGAVAVGIFSLCSFSSASAATLPQIEASPRNAVPQCVTPGRLMAFVRDRNPRLARKYADLSVHYMRIGDELGVRWDYAFYQMLVETGSLTYKGDVSARQNNFAGIGATGGGAPGESFPTVAEGVRAHIQHLMIYAGLRVESPVADRTAKVQSWGILDKWRRRFGGRSVRYSDMTTKWSPGDRGYARDIKSVADRFMQTRCQSEDPEPGLVAGIRSSSNTRVASAGETSQFAQQAIERARNASTATRSSLGAPVTNETVRPRGSLSQGISVLNSNAGSNAAPTASNTPKTPSTDRRDDRVASAGSVGRFASNLIGSVKPPASASAEPNSCRVWTASYGGQRALIIKSISKAHVNYTVLDVNSGREEREADAYIAAYAKGGTTIAKFGDPTKALKRAFELCPESAAK